MMKSSLVFIFVMLYNNIQSMAIDVKVIKDEMMKKDIHPESYRTVLFYDSSAETGWLIRSCAPTHNKTMVWTDGKEYPVFMLDTSSASHPVYTGRQREHNKEGRASQFNQRYGNMMNALKKG